MRQSARESMRRLGLIVFRGSAGFSMVLLKHPTDPHLVDPLAILPNREAAEAIADFMCESTGKPRDVLEIVDYKSNGERS